MHPINRALDLFYCCLTGTPGAWCSIELFVHVFANLMEGRTTEQKKALSEKVIRALKELLPAVEIISMNIRDFEQATYCNATMIEIDDGSG